MTAVGGADQRPAAEPKPELATNRAGRTVAEALNGYITHAATGFVGGARLDIASAYFNVGGYSLVADSLDHLTGARLLLGAEPMPPENRPRTLGDESARPERAAAARLRRALEGHERDLTTDRDLLGFSVETDAAVRRLVAWLQSGRVQVRRLEGRFLHGKAFLVSDRSHGVVAGSSNFTHAGLATNLELNLGNYSPHVVRQVQEWFEELWAEAVDYDLAALFEGRFEPHPPQLIYLRMLWQLYGDDLAAEAAASIGVGEVLPEQTGRDISFTETREEIERIRREDAALFERGGTARGVLSGEEYRQELRRAVEQGYREQIETLPWGSGSGMAAAGDGGRAGYVFCVQVGDWPQPLFRYVELGGEAEPNCGGPTGGEPAVIAETLACLDRARPPDGFDTPRVLDDETYRGAFDAWAVARSDIVERWNFLADKANLEPRVPRALLRAAEILRSHPPADLTQDKIDRTIDAVCAPYPERIIRTFRAAVAGTDDVADQARNVLGVVRNLGLEPYTPPRPLPEITSDDVHLVCWLALV